MVSAPKLQRGNTVSGLLMGLLIGIIIAAAIALYINFGPKPFVTEAKTDSTSQSTPAASAIGTPIELPGKPGDRPVKVSPPATPAQSQPSAPDKDKLDFYTILPGGEAASAPQPKPAGVQSDKPGLQAGAYQNPSDADNLKARLAMLGVEAKVQRVDLGDKGIFYRVRLGPFGSLEEADGMRARLATEGIETSLVRSNSSTANTKH